MAASRRNPGILWLHDDSGGKPELHAVDARGKLRGRIRLDASSGDWEDLAAAEIDGRAYLFLGDTGDNDAKRSKVYLHVIPEPSASELSPASSLPVKPVASFRITYPDGPRDCESVAVDPVERAVYLLSKRDPTPRLYRIDLPSPLRGGDVTPRFIGEVPNLPQRGQKRRDGRVLSWPVAMDFAPSGRLAAVLTYTQPVLFTRAGGESWASALARTPVVLPPHNLPQAEAMAFSADGSALYVASEKSRNLVRYDLAPGVSPPVPVKRGGKMARRKRTPRWVWWTASLGAVALVVGGYFLLRAPRAAGTQTNRRR